jgi:GNAT superfamily N-acetyltransferase
MEGGVITIRELGAGDEQALVDLNDAVDPGWSDRHEPLAAGPADFLGDGASFAVGAYEGGAPAGWAWGVHIRRPNGWCMTYLHQLDVSEPYRRQGIATKLVQASMDIARSTGSSQLWLSTGAHNDVARALYDHLGGDRKPQGDVNYWWNL